MPASERQAARSATVIDRRRAYPRLRRRVSSPVSNSTGTAWTAPDGRLLGMLLHPRAPPSGLPSLTVHRLPAAITARTSNQFRGQRRRSPAIVEVTLCNPVPSANGDVVALRTMPIRALLLPFGGRSPVNIMRRLVSAEVGAGKLETPAAQLGITFFSPPLPAIGAVGLSQTPRQ